MRLSSSTNEVRFLRSHRGTDELVSCLNVSRKFAAVYGMTFMAY